MSRCLTESFLLLFFSASVISLVNNTLSVNEGVGMVQICVQLISGVEAQFMITFENGTAFGMFTSFDDYYNCLRFISVDVVIPYCHTAGQDFDNAVLTGEFTADSPSQLCLNVVIINDSLAENCLESFTANLISNDAVVTALSSVEIEIVDNDGKSRPCNTLYTGSSV